MKQEHWYYWFNTWRWKDKVKDIQFTTDDLLQGIQKHQDVVKEPQTFNTHLNNCKNKNSQAFKYYADFFLFLYVWIYIFWSTLF